MPFDALVLLGCPVRGGALRGAAERRVSRAAGAYREGLAPLVVVSGGRRWAAGVEADVMAAALLERGVPDGALHLERESGTTRENARNSARVLGALGAKTVGLVSCDWHLPRALWCFRRVGLTAEPVPALAPHVGALARAGRTLRERGAWLLDRAVMLGW